MTRRTAVTATLLMLVSLAHASPSLLARRQVSLEATFRDLDAAQRCHSGVDARTDIVAFPVGRADRVYIYSLGLGRAYRIQDGEARLVWCGKALYTPEAAKASASRLAGNAARALGYPFRTLSGRLPVEKGGMDIFSSFAGFLTTMRMNAAGKVICSRERGNPAEGEYRSAFQFGDRSAFQFGAQDTCP